MCYRAVHLSLTAPDRRMKIICITLARSSVDYPIQNSFLLPLQLLAIAGDLLDAGHQVSWVDEVLRRNNMDKVIDQVASASPDVLFFACVEQPSLLLTASIAVKTDSLLGNEFICEDVMRPASKWRDTLCNHNISVELLVDKIQRYQKHRSLNFASNASSYASNISGQ